MTDDQALSFGAVAAAYDRGRPSYPVEAARWAVGGPARTVLELGAGTGKLTERLVALGHDVIATDPDVDMLDLLSARVPGATVHEGTAEAIPASDRSVDVVIAAQAFHWFDHDRAMPEIARVLKPRGHLAVTWNERDERIPWVRRLGDLIGREELQGGASVDVLHSSGMFGFVEEESFKHWQDINRESVLDLVRSRSRVAVMPEADREALLARVLAFYDDYGRGMDGMHLPYVTRCARAVVIDRPRVGIADAQPRAGSTEQGEPSDRPDGPDRDVSDGSDADMLLIDFD